MSTITYRSAIETSADLIPNPTLPGYPVVIRESSALPINIEKPERWIEYKPRSLSANWRRELSEGDATTEMDAFTVDTDPKVTMMFARYFTEKDSLWISGAERPGYYRNEQTFRGIPMPSDLFTPFEGYEQELKPDLAGDLWEVKLFRRRCLEDFSARLAKNYELQGVTFLAELHRSRDLLRKPVEALASDATKWAEKTAKYTSKLKRDPKQLLKVVSDRYLEGQFGWRPLMGDIQDIASIVRKSSDTKRSESTHHQHRELTSSPVREVVSTFGSVPNIPGLRVSHSIKRYASVSIKYSAAVRMVEQTELEKRLGSIGFLPSQLPGELWELARFSFIMDYFYNIQNVLEYTPDLRHRIRYNSCTYSDSLIQEHEWYEDGTSPAFLEVIEVSPAKIVAKSRHTKRFKDQELGTLIVPTIRVPKKVQLVNLGALSVALLNI
jgi:hypothetical protein